MSILVTLTILFLFPGSAVSIGSYPNCTAVSLTTYPWLLNSLKQDPCAVAVYLESTCWAAYSLEPLPSVGFHYTGPPASDGSDSCMCNTVMYSLISACGWCQGSPQWISWLGWKTNCVAVEPPASFPNLVPAGTVVPQWALIDVTGEGTWDSNTSMTAGASPGIAAGQQVGSPTHPPAGTLPLKKLELRIVTPSMFPPSPTIMYPSTPSPSAPSTSPSTSSPSPTPSRGHTSDIGVIVGGAVGGIAVIGIVIVSIVYIRRRRNESPYATSSAYVAPQTPFVVDVSQQSPIVPVSPQSPTELEGKKPLADEGTLVSSFVLDSPVISPTVHNSDMPTTLPEPQNDPNIYIPNVSNTAIFGQHQGSRNNVPYQAPRPQYRGLHRF